MAIDRQRGALIRKYGSGARCVMYYDEPGVYYDENGGRLSKEIAKAAGFDVAADTQAAARNRVRSRTEQQLAIKFKEAEQRISEMSADEIAGIRIIEHGGVDRYALVDGDGNMLCQIIFNYDEAVEFYDSITGQSWSTEDEGVDASLFEAMTVAELKGKLKAAEVEVPGSAKKADLVALAEEHLAESGDDGEGADDFL